MIHRLNEGFVPPDQYLGENVEKVQLKYGQVVWSTNCVDYLKSAIENFDNSLGVDKTELKNFGDGHSPELSIFRSELYDNEELGDGLTNKYQQLIEVMRWSIELGIK